MPGGTRLVLRPHELLVVTVVVLAAELEGALHGEIEAVGVQAGAEAAEELGQRGAELVAGGVGEHGGLLVGSLGGHVAVSILDLVDVLPVQALAGLLIDTGELVHVSVVEGSANLVDLVAGADTVLGNALIQAEDGVLVAAQVEVPVPEEVAGIDDRTVEGEFETAVADGAHVHGDTTGRVTGGKRNVLVVEQVLGVAVEVLDGTVQAALEEFEIDTGVEGLGGLPGQLLVTLVGKGEGVVRTVIGVDVLVGVRIGAEAVVTKHTVAGLELEHAHPRGVEPALLADEPGCTEGTEVTPAVTGREAGRCIAAERGGQEDRAVVVVLRTGEEAFGHVGAGAGAHGLVGTVGVVDFTYERVEEVVVGTVNALGLAVVLLVTGEDVEMMDVGDVELVLGQVLLVDGEHTAVTHGSGTVNSAGVRAVEVVVAGVVVGDADVGVEGEALDRSQDEAPLAHEHVGIGLLGVVVEIADGVAHDGRTREVRVVGVVDLAALLSIEVRETLLIDLADIQRIDRTDVVGDVEGVAGGTPATGGHVVGVRIGVADIGGEADPVLDLILGVQTGGVALVTGVIDDTAVVQVADCAVVVETVRGAAGGDVVLLTDGIVEGLLVPVVRLIVVLAVGIAELGVRVDLEVGTDELLAVGNGIDLVAQTAVLVVEEDPVSVSVGLGDGVAGVEVLVVPHLVEGLVVLCGIADHVVLGNQAGVDTVTGVKTHLGFAALTALGGDEDDAVGSTVTVDSGSGSILQDGHRLDIVGVDVGDGALVRGAVHDDKRGGARAHGADTADADGRAAAGRVTAGGDDLHTRGRAGEGTRHLGGQFLGDGLAAHHRCGTREGALGGSTVSDDDGLVQHLAVRLEADIHLRPAADLHALGKITHSRDIERSVGGCVDGVSTVCVRGGTGHGTLDHDRSKRDTLACLRITNRTRHPDILGVQGRCDQHKHGAEEQFCFFHKH